MQGVAPHLHAPLDAVAASGELLGEAGGVLPSSISGGWSACSIADVVARVRHGQMPLESSVSDSDTRLLALGRELMSRKKGGSGKTATALPLVVLLFCSSTVRSLVMRLLIPHLLQPSPMALTRPTPAHTHARCRRGRALAPCSIALAASSSAWPPSSPGVAVLTCCSSPCPLGEANIDRCLC